jgi:acyl dehydratase
MNGKDGWTGTVRGMPDTGSVAERSKTVSNRDIELFTEITGDRNPLHYDESLVQESVFGGVIVQAALPQES